MYFDSFEIEYTPQEVLKKDKSFTNNRFRIISNKFIKCWIHRVTFIQYVIEGKTLLDLRSPNDYQKYYKIMYKYAKDKYDNRKPKSWL